jgi:HEAT repeat protein
MKMLKLILVASSICFIAGQLPADQKTATEKSAQGKTDETAKSATAPTVGELKEQLKDKAIVVRRVAAQQLGALGIRALEAVPAMIEALGDPEPVVRASVAEALGGIGVTAKAAVPALLKLLKDSNADVRETAAEALADIGVDAPKVVPALLELLTDADMNVRCAAAKSLGDFRAAARDAVPALEKLKTQDKHPLVREAAVEALQTIQKAMQKLGS